MPLTAQRFFDFVEKETNEVESVFILGDLFEYWVGDDAGARSPFQQEVLRALTKLSNKTKTYYIHGNRDRKSTRLNSSHSSVSRMPSSA